MPSKELGFLPFAAQSAAVNAIRTVVDQGMHERVFYVNS